MLFRKGWATGLFWAAEEEFVVAVVGVVVVIIVSSLLETLVGGVK